MRNINDVYRKAYTEVMEIIDHFSKEEYSKIPEEKIDFYRENMDREYQFKINPNVDLAEQNISREANAILISLFRDYFATEIQKEKINVLLKKNQEQLEELKRQKYSYDNLFKAKKEEVKDVETLKSEMQLVEYKETFFNKFVNFIKKLINWK